MSVKVCNAYAKNYCALDNAIQKYFNLANESFFVAMIVVSRA
jgi:hypothetical protein